MPLANIILIVLIGLVLGVMSSVLLKNRGLLFLINIALGILGSCLGAFAPVLIGSALSIDVSNPSYLLRALFASFVMVLLAALFRPVRPRGAL